MIELRITRIRQESQELPRKLLLEESIRTQVAAFLFLVHTVADFRNNIYSDLQCLLCLPSHAC
jgi:hypothetical protein